MGVCASKSFTLACITLACIIDTMHSTRMKSHLTSSRRNAFSAAKPWLAHGEKCVSQYLPSVKCMHELTHIHASNHSQLMHDSAYVPDLQAHRSNDCIQSTSIVMMSIQIQECGGKETDSGQRHFQVLGKNFAMPMACIKRLCR